MGARHAECDILYVVRMRQQLRELRAGIERTAKEDRSAEEYREMDARVRKLLTLLECRHWFKS